MRLVREQLLCLLRAADAKHPCEQGILASLGVFLDTIVICTLTGFVVVMAHCWTGENAQVWAELDKLPKFTESIAVLTPGTSMNAVITFLVTLCFGLFAFTCLLGMISFQRLRLTVSGRMLPALILYAVLPCLWQPLVSCAIWQDLSWEICGHSRTWEIF